MEKLEIEDVTRENLDDLIGLCVPPNKRDHPLFIEGMRLKKKWASQVMGRYGSIAKLAYLRSRPVGMIQYLPHPEEKSTWVRCVFVPHRENLRKGVGKSLWKALAECSRNASVYFENETPLALVVYAFEVFGVYAQHEFFGRMGFRRVKEDDPHLLYYPVRDGFVYSPAPKEFIPQAEDKGKAVIFFDPSCPFCIYFSEEIKKSITSIAPKIPIRMIDEFKEAEEVRKRGKVPFCIVNKKPIESFFMDKENFQREVKEALGF